jgi:putative heme-binding domain-containing protein
MAKELLLALIIPGSLVAVRAADRESSLPTLAQVKAGQLKLDRILPLLDSDDPAWQQALSEAARRRPEWADEAVTLLRGWLTRPELSEARRRELAGVLGAFSDHADVRAMVTQALTDPRTNQALRLALVQGLARIRVEPLPDPWVDALGQCLHDPDLAVRTEAAFAVRSRDLNQFDDVLGRLWQQTDLPIDLRLAALESLVPRWKSCSPAAFAFLHKQLASAEPLTGIAAARTLGKSRLDASQLVELAGALHQRSASQIVLCLPAFTRSKDVKVGLRLVHGLERASLSGVLTSGDLDRVLAPYPGEVQGAASMLRANLLDRHRPAQERLRELSDELPPGDARRGKAVFVGNKAPCAGCHRAAGLGGSLGPNLSRIGIIRSHHDLLESIVLPSAGVAPEFRAYSITTRNGQVHAGLLFQETVEAIYLRTAPTARARITRSDIEEIALSPVSVMPDGLERLLTRQELSDLVEFLATQR